MTTGLAIYVLVIDDEAMIRRNLCAFLEDEGYVVFAAESSEAALRLLESQYIDIGIIDIRLSGMDGNTFVMRAHPLYPRMKFLIHTGSSNYQLPAELAAIGIQPEDIFMKPVSDMTTLAQAI